MFSPAAFAGQAHSPTAANKQYDLLHYEFSAVKFAVSHLEGLTIRYDAVYSP